MMFGWFVAAALYFFLLRPYGSHFPKSVLLNYCVVPAFVFIVILVVTLLIRPVYSYFGFGQLGRIDEPLAMVQNSLGGEVLFSAYQVLAMVCIVLAAYSQLAFFIVFAANYI